LDKKKSSLLGGIAKAALGGSTPQQSASNKVKTTDVIYSASGKSSAKSSAKSGIAGALLGAATGRTGKNGLAGALLGAATGKTSKGGIANALLRGLTGAGGAAALANISKNVMNKSGNAQQPQQALANPDESESGERVSAAPTLNFEKVKFGPYDWLVLERKDGRALLITEGIIERGPYHSKREGITWEGCDLRRYLNGAFLNKFEEGDKERIAELTNVNADNPWFPVMSGEVNTTPGADGTRIQARDAKGGNPTQDKIFLLSIEEVCRYFGDSTAPLRNKPTWSPGASLADTARISDGNNANRLAIMPGHLSTSSDKTDKPYRWWLRSPGEADVVAAYVNPQGCVHIAGATVWAVEKRETSGIRPVVWVREQ